MNPGQEKYAGQAARLLATKLPAEESRRPSTIERDAMVARMVEVMDGRRRQRRLFVGAGLVALAASAVVGLRLASSSVDKNDPNQTAQAPVAVDIHGADNLLVRDDGTQFLRGPIALRSGDHVIASHSGGASLSFEDGTRADMGEESDVAIAELGKNRKLSLGRGRLDVRVAKLGAGRRFQVATPDSVVEVHGTVFSVSVDKDGKVCPGADSRTRVRVSEGVVSVEHAGNRVFLHAGDVWPCAGQVAAAPEQPQADQGTEVGPAAAPAAKRPRQRPLPLREEDFTRRPTTATPAASNLAEQNDLFGEAMAAERRNENAAAVQKLETLLRRFPGGPLEESARAERRKLLEKTAR